MRHVTGGGGSLAPGTQDVIHIIESTTPSEAPLLSRDDAYPVSYGVFLNTGAEPVSIEMPGLATEPLCFASYDQAEALQRYLGLAASGGRLGDAAVGWNRIVGAPRPLTPSDSKRLETRSNCATPPAGP